MRADLLAAVADPARGLIDIPVAVVVAHPDDETIGCGALLPRLADMRLIHVTDGAPADGILAARCGFDSPAAYARARRGELEAAMTLAGIGRDRLDALDVPDQQAALRLADIARALVPRLAGVAAVLTHAYEGGHPDHDAVAFAVRAACRLLARTGAAPAIVEFPLYCAGPDGWLIQSFAPNSAGDPAPEIRIDLTPAERALKRAMLAAHASQADVLVRFPPAFERFRLATEADFRALPNGGDLLYERYGWMTGPRWMELATAALAELAGEA